MRGVVSRPLWAVSISGRIPLASFIPLPFQGCEPGCVAPVGVRDVRGVDIHDDVLEALLQNGSVLFVKVVGECESRGYLLAATVVPMVTLAPVAPVVALAPVAPVVALAPVAPVAPVVAVTPAVLPLVTVSLVVVSETLEDLSQLCAILSVSFCTGRSQLHDMPGHLFSLLTTVTVDSVTDRLAQALDSVADALVATAVLIINTVVSVVIDPVIILVIMRMVNPVTLTTGIGRIGVLLQIEHLVIGIPQFERRSDFVVRLTISGEQFLAYIGVDISEMVAL